LLFPKSKDSLVDISYHAIDAADLVSAIFLYLPTRILKPTISIVRLPTALADSVLGVRGVEVYKSKNLNIRKVPQVVFQQPDDFWANVQV